MYFGAASVMAPAYISEIAPPQYRGRLTTASYCNAKFRESLSGRRISPQKMSDNWVLLQ